MAVIWLWTAARVPSGKGGKGPGKDAVAKGGGVADAKGGGKEKGSDKKSKGKAREDPRDKSSVACRHFAKGLCLELVSQVTDLHG